MTTITDHPRGIATPPNDTLAISIDEAAKRSGLGRSTLYELMQTGELAYSKIGARRLILVADLQALLAAHRRVDAAPVSSAVTAG